MNADLRFRVLGGLWVLCACKQPDIQTQTSTTAPAIAAATAHPRSRVLPDAPELSCFAASETNTHMLGRWAITVCTNDLGTAGLSTSHEPFEKGTTFVAEHRSNERDSKKTMARFQMTKTENGTWRFEVAGQKSVDERCAQCHSEAPHDYVFRR